MKSHPFVSVFAQAKDEHPVFEITDELTSTDALPAILERDRDGYVLTRETRITAVKPETTDDK
jgi:hypothetical protein